MWSTVPGVALLIVLAVAVLPLPRVRRWLLTAAARVGQAAVLACLGACGTFFVDPRSAPPWLVHAVRPLLEGALGLPNAASTGVPWLVLAVVAVGVTLPVLIVVELAISFSSQTAQVQALRKEIRHAAAWVDNRLAVLGVTGPAYPPLPNEAAAASEALRSAGQPANQTPPAPLVIDLFR